MDVSDIVDEKSQVESISEFPSNSSVFVDLGGFQVLGHVVDAPSHVELFWVHCGVVVIKIRLVNKVPWGLVAHTLVFDVIGKSSTFHKSVIGFVLVKIGKWFEELLCFGNDLWGDLLKVVVGDTGS